MSDPVAIKDASGRTLELRELDVLQQVRLLRAAGPDDARNQPLMEMIQAAAMVATIDGIPMPLPGNAAGIDAMIKRVGTAGYAALIAHMRKVIEDTQAAAEAAAAGEATAASPLAQPG